MWQKTKNIYHLAIAVLANTYFLFPARKLKVIGITGTDGKTTTTSLVYHILKTAGKRVSLISTVAAYIGDITYDTGFHVTNPSSIPLQRFIKKITSLGTGKEENYLVLEVTSHGIDQNRIWGIPFVIAGLTNVTHEHLDYHKTYENYVATKTKLLKRGQIVVINKDDKSYTLVKHCLGKKKNVITYGKKNADVTPETITFTCTLPGEYNTYNCLLAVAICRQLGITDTDIQKGIAAFTLPKGRMEIVYQNDFTVIVDFAHTPNALKQLLSTLRPQVKEKLIHVFGSAGLRDKTKRPLMGKEAGAYDDIIILTAEDPRSEKVGDISSQIKAGIRGKNVEVLEETDRKKAIVKAISLAKKGDYVVITGKGHEMTMNYGHGEEQWSDVETVQEAVNNL